jgi:hypothetical protein
MVTAIVIPISLYIPLEWLDGEDAVQLHYGLFTEWSELS